MEERSALDDLLDEVKENGYTEEYTGPADPPEIPYVPTGNSVIPTGEVFHGKVDHPVVSMNDQLKTGNMTGPKYRVIPLEGQLIVYQHETAPLIRSCRGDEWATIAGGENGKYWRIVEQEEA